MYPVSINTLLSGTSEMKGYTFHYKGHNVNLIDTPGFDDTHKSETEVLTSIATWLEESYGNHEKLNGVIYLHSINKPRMEGSALRNLRLFRQLCGESPLKNVVLGTTFWGAVNEEAGKSREKELRQRPEFWGQMVERGSHMMRVTDRASALEIVDYLMPMIPVPLEIQKEMVDQEKHLIDTAAGQHITKNFIVERNYTERSCKRSKKNMSLQSKKKTSRSEPYWKRANAESKTTSIKSIVNKNS